MSLLEAFPSLNTCQKCPLNAIAKILTVAYTFTKTLTFFTFKKFISF